MGVYLIFLLLLSYYYLQPALELLVKQLLEKPGYARDELVNKIESEKLKEMLISILGKIKSQFGEDAYNKPMQPIAKASAD